MATQLLDKTRLAGHPQDHDTQGEHQAHSAARGQQLLDISSHVNTHTHSLLLIHERDQTILLLLFTLFYYLSRKIFGRVFLFYFLPKLEKKTIFFSLI